MALVVLDKEALWAGVDTAALVQAGWGAAGCTVVCRWPSAEPAGGMTCSACLRVIQEGVRRTSGCADAVLQVTGRWQEGFLWFQTAEAI